MNAEEINNEIGDIDLFLLDLILKGMITKDMHILDAGCGSGRNMFYFLRQGIKVVGIDQKESEVKAANFLSRSLGQGDISMSAAIADLPFEANSFDFIICSRVLHFAESTGEFAAMLAELRRVLSPEGLLYLSMDSMIGVENLVREVGKDKFQFPDGSVRFMLTKTLLRNLDQEWGHVIEPRTVNFNDQHNETTLLLSIADTS